MVKKTIRQILARAAMDILKNGPTDLYQAVVTVELARHKRPWIDNGQYTANR